MKIFHTSGGTFVFHENSDSISSSVSHSRDFSNDSSSSRTSSTSPRPSGATIVRLLALLLVFTSVVSLLLGHGQTISLKSLLDTLTSLPEVDIQSFLDTVAIPEITSDWGTVLNYLRDWLNFCSSMLNNVVSFFVFIGTGFAQILSIFVNFVRSV